MENITLAIWNDASNNHGNLWTIYILVVSAVLGFSFSEHFARIVSECNELAWVTVFVLAVFMISNIVSLNSNFNVLDDARNALLEIVQKSSTENEKTISIVTTAIETTNRTRWPIFLLHAVLDVSILVGISIRIRRAT